MATKFRTNYNSKVILSKQTDKTKMTVPGQAKTNTEHITQARMGISDQTVKLIYDPNNNYPDIRTKDLVDQRAMIKGARALVEDLKMKHREAQDVATKLRQEAEAKAIQQQDERIMKLLNQQKTKEKGASL